MVFPFKVVEADRKFPGIEVRSVGCRGDGSLPRPAEIRKDVVQNHTIEDISPATGGPRFADQGAIPETALISVEIINDLVNDLRGYVDRAPVDLGGSNNFRTDRNCRKRRNLTIGSPRTSIGVGGE